MSGRVGIPVLAEPVPKPPICGLANGLLNCPKWLLWQSALILQSGPLLISIVIWPKSTAWLEMEESYMTSGPTSRVTEVGDYCQTANGDELWDEKLTEDQIDVICSVYKVEREEGQGKKGERNDGWGRLTEHVLWFPKDASWWGCGMDVSFWSSDAETWYLGGEFKCKNQTEWKRLLKLWQDAPKMSAALEKASEEFLDRHIMCRCKWLVSLFELCRQLTRT